MSKSVKKQNSKSQNSSNEPRVIKIKLPTASAMSAMSIPLSIVFAGVLISVSLISAGNSVRDVLKAQGGLGTAQQQQVQQEPTTAEPTNATVTLGSMDRLGSGDAKVAIVEFSDFECPFCSRFHGDAAKQIKSEYINNGKAQMYYRHLPLEFHPNALPLAKASTCANEQGKFWSFHDGLFDNVIANGRKVTDGLAVGTANQIGLDINKFNECVANNKFANIVSQDSSDAQAAGINGTPGFVIGVIKDGKIENGTIVSGAQPFSEFKKVIDSYL